MDDVIGGSGLWTGQKLWSTVRKAPVVVLLAGIDHSEIVDVALADPALSETLITRFEPACRAPCDALLWRLETGAGDSLDRSSMLSRYWQRQPYAVTIRLVQYQPGSVTPDVLDEGTIGTRGSRDAFMAAVDRLAMRFIRDAALGRSRGVSGAMPAAAPFGPPGWLAHARARWHNRLLTEWWSLGTTDTPIADLIDGGALASVTWYHPHAGERYLADPFPWPGTGLILCEEMPVYGGVGRIVAVSESKGVLSPPVRVVLDEASHHSYPCTFQDGDVVYCVPEATERGATRINRLDDDGRLVSVCDVAPHARLADPTLFKWNGRFWLGCTDLDLGEHDNLCFLHADSLAGPWVPHACWPVKIDVRGARSAGMPLYLDGRLFRPGQDCAATYGAGVALHEITTLTETTFQETLVTVLRPDPAGLFPHGLHTLVHDGARFWIDGKRFVLNFGLLRHKLKERAMRRLAVTGRR